MFCGVPVDVGTAPLLCQGFAGDPGQLTLCRRELRAWATGAGASSDDAADMSLAAYEALANAAEHAYRSEVGPIDLFAGRMLDSRIMIAVCDRGRWRPVPLEPGLRGRGLGIMQALAHQIDVQRGPEGTTVLMWWA